MSTIEETIYSISTPLTHIFNLSITSGIFPIEQKIARVIMVIPLFKTDVKSMFSNHAQSYFCTTLFLQDLRKSPLLTPYGFPK